jgi:glycosyltransferase involved in cell wall biosynthesis
LERFNLLNKRILAMTGFIFDRKRHERAIALLPRFPADVVLCLLGGPNGAGSEDYCRRLRRQALDLGVETRVVITGYLKEAEMNAGLSSATAFLAPYSDVTNSASLAQCIAGGGPIVAEKCESFVELEREGAGLVCVDSGASGEWYDAIRRILADANFARKLREKNIKYSEGHSFGLFSRQMSEWHEALVANGGKGA